MFKSYLKIAWRNLFNNKSYSIINIGGLAVGMAVAILIGLWIYDEVSFNNYHQNYNSIAQISTHLTSPQGERTNDHMQYPLTTELKSHYAANFKHIVVASWPVDDILSKGEKKFSREGLFMDAGAPEMLTLKMIYGERSGLKDPHSIMLSESTAKAFFGNTDPVNQMMKINNKMDVKVTGVYEDLPLNTTFNELKFISTIALWESDNPWIRERAINDWGNHFLKIYVQINPNSSFEKVSAAIEKLEMKNLGNFKDEASLNPRVFLLPMSQLHLHNFRRGLPDTAALQMVWLVAIIGGFVILLACINFMNLSTARSQKRAKEVGIRKSVGSMRGQLIGQFLSESFLVVVLAFILSMVLVVLSLSWFNALADKQIKIPYLNPYFWTASGGFIIITSFLSGIYPAFYLSSFNPVKVLKGTFRVGRFASVPRKILVSTQFTISVALIICTIIIYRQIQLAKNRPIGYSRDGLLMIEKKSEDFNGKYDLMRTELKNTGVVTDMSESYGKVTEIASGNIGFEWKGMDPKLNAQFGTLPVSFDYGKTVGWQFVQGRDFSRQFPTDSFAMVINEAALASMQLENPIGEKVSWKFQDQEPRHYTIVGVVKDMVMESPYAPMTPTVFMIKGHVDPNWINIKINPKTSIAQALPKIEAVFKKLIPSAPFEYKFADEEYVTKFAAEERIGKLSRLFAILAIFISCLGLFGLASFVAEQRTKEIGVRKVLGASVVNLWSLLSGDFIKLVIISCFIAAPLAWYFMSGWLQKYSYRTDMSWWIFAAAGCGALLITLCTVSFQAIRAAVANPVQSLRSE